MGESGLSLDFFGLRREVAFYLGLGRDKDSWSDDDLAAIDAHIRSGLRSFYNPAGYSWSFFKPVATLAIDEDNFEYDLPDDFSFVEGDVVIQGDLRAWALEKVSSTMILAAPREVRGFPSRYAVVPKDLGEMNGQRYSLMLFPQPHKTLELTLRYSVVPRALTTSQPFPYGGVQHSETIREACLAAAEADSDDQLSVHRQLFQERLAASIDYDKRASTPDTLGYNGDGRRDLMRRKQAQVFVNGQLVSGEGTSCRWVIG